MSYTYVFPMYCCSECNPILLRNCQRMYHSNLQWKQLVCFCAWGYRIRYSLNLYGNMLLHQHLRMLKFQDQISSHLKQMYIHIRFTFVNKCKLWDKLTPSYNKYINNFDFDLEKSKDFQRFMPQSWVDCKFKPKNQIIAEM